MEQSYASKYHGLEERHWWFFGRRDMVYKLVKSYKRDSEILEIGCSGGPLLEFLKGQGFRNLRGIDVNNEAVEICRQKGIDKVCLADGIETGFKDKAFDIIIASDVLEHIEREDKAISEWYRILKPGGKLIVFVPAFKFLWSKHDEVNCHYRRYRRYGLLQILKISGFNIERSSYWNVSLFFPIAIVRLFQKLLPVDRHKLKDHLQEMNSLINKIFEYILRLENKLLSKGINLPFGVSLFAIARKG